jgi:hypothetical protein
MFYVVFAIVLTLAAWVAMTRGLRGLGPWGWGAALVLPTWVFRYVSAINFDVRMATTALVIGALLLSAATWRKLHFIFADVLFGLLALSLLGSEYINDDLMPSTFLIVGSEWILPYVFGRLVCASAKDLKQLTACSVCAIVILCGWTMFESVTRVNPVAALFGQPPSLQGLHDLRWHLKRAEGPLQHPISLGMMLVLAMPWSLDAAHRAKHKDGPSWWQLAPWMNGVALLMSLSRGPQAALALTFYLVAFFRWPRWRTGLLVLAITATLGTLAAREAALDFVRAWSGEREEKGHVMIDGELIEYSGTNHRLIQFQVFYKAMKHAGWFGYGRKRTTTTETKTMDIPYVEPDLLVRFWSVDNHYIVTWLRSGYLSLVLFVLLGLHALGKLIRPAFDLQGARSLMAAAMFGAIGSTMIVLSTVWLAPDFGYMWLFSVGLTCSWQQALAKSQKPTAPTPAVKSPFVAPVRRVPMRRLVPGHAVC